jgi:hypothetical protein
MDTFFKTLIYCVLVLSLFYCSGCGVFGGGERVCPEGFLKKVEYETDRNGDRVIRAITCYPKDGQRP